jgi:hypothetical protein
VIEVEFATEVDDVEGAAATVEGAGTAVAGGAGSVVGGAGVGGAAVVGAAPGAAPGPTVKANVPLIGSPSGDTVFHVTVIAPAGSARTAWFTVVSTTCAAPSL